VGEDPNVQTKDSTLQWGYSEKKILCLEVKPKNRWHAQQKEFVTNSWIHWGSGERTKNIRISDSHAFLNIVQSYGSVGRGRDPWPKSSKGGLTSPNSRGR